MSQGMIKQGRRVMWAAALALGFAGAASADTIKTVYSNNPDPGDSYTLADGTLIPLVHAPGWVYENIRADTTVGINTTFARSGNGSAYFNTTSGTGKADITYYLGQNIALDQVTALGYDWYRAAGFKEQAPSLRLVLSNFKQLIWEPVYNPPYNDVNSPDFHNLPLNSWETTDALDGGAGVFWYSGDLNGTLVYQSFDKWLTDAKLAGLTVIGVNSGVGSGWNVPFEGAVDNIRLGIGGVTTTYNFEVVPEPSSVAMGLIAGAAGLLLAARRRRSA